MRWGFLFFSADGRIGQRDFWLAAVILVVLGVVSRLMIGVGSLVWLVSFYCWICVFSKRLHDMGRSGWLQAIPFLLGWSLMSLGFFMGAASIIGLLASGSPHVIGGVVFASLVLAFALSCLGGLVHLILALWVGLSPGQIGLNRYGPAPGPAFAAPPA